LLLECTSERLHVTPSALFLEQIDARLIVDFLNHLETARANHPSSRNVRLAAIKSFMHFMEFREPAPGPAGTRALPRSP
jgi:integrase/recombinase XerD